MTPVAAASYGELLEAVFGSPAVAEPESLPGLERPPSELELQSRWFSGDFGTSFTTLSGQRVEVVQFGVWNHAAGPDFLEAAVEIAGRRLRGAVELDLEARDWERHGHALNPAYEQTVLHVFFAQPPGARFFTRTCSHREVAQVCLSAEGVGPPARLAAEARCGRCSYPLQDWPPEKVEALLRMAARHRLTRKGRRLERLAALHGAEQALFQELAGALGYRHNQLPMTVLAQRLPLKMLHEHGAGAEALLFGVAGFLESRIYEAAAPDTRDYLRGLWAAWWKHRDEFAGSGPLRWHAGGSRPANHPQRRIGALATAVAAWRRLAPALRRGAEAGARELALLEHPYWSHHFTLTSRRLERPLALIGSSRIREIVANLLLPLEIARSPQAWESYERLPAATGNEKSRRAALRLLGRRPDAARFSRRLHQQQGLLQLYDDFCLQDSSDCAECPFPEQLARWGDT